MSFTNDSTDSLCQLHAEIEKELARRKQQGMAGAQNAERPSATISTIRGQLLLRARELTEGDRNQAYGDPLDNLGAQGRLALVVEEIHQNPSFQRLPAAYKAGLLGSLHQITGKLARIIRGDVDRVDNYIDGAAYFGIAGECVIRAGMSEPQAAAPQPR